VLTRTEVLWDDRGPEDSFARHQRVKLTKLSGEQEELSTHLDPIVEAIEHEDSAVFAPILRGCKDDMLEASRRLRRKEPGEICQGIQRDVIARLAELQEVFREERERQNQQQGQPQEPQPQGDQPIVAPVAELRALKRMQEALTRKLELLRTESLPDDPAALTPHQRSRLERLAHQQGTIRTMFRDLARRIGVGEETFEEPAAGEGGTESGGDEGGGEEETR